MSSDASAPSGPAEGETPMDYWIRARHSTRSFLPTPVPRHLLDEALALAQTSPSNSNTQPWRLFITSGAARDRLAKALMAAAEEGEALNIPPLPEAFKHYRSELGHQIYGTMHIPREDKARKRAAELRNFEFFGAPVGAVLCIVRKMESWDSMSVGMYLQTLMLALTERGLGTCAEVSVVGYPNVLRKELGIGDDLDILTGLAIGFPDEAMPVNHLPFSRDAIDSYVHWFEE